jgi:1-deoxy-D-xylulose-5-phosphate reductoisomerase
VADRVPDAAAGCDWTRAATWEFEPLDDEAFPAVALARSAGRTGGTAPAVYNAANEVAVEAFAAGRLGFLRIVDIVARVVTEQADGGLGNSLTVADVLDAEARARARAAELVREGAPA